MKVKKGYSGLDNFSLCFASDKADLFKLPGNDAKMGLINHLFNAGKDEEARKVFREALAEITGKLDKILDKENNEADRRKAEPTLASFFDPGSLKEGENPAVGFTAG